MTQPVETLLGTIAVERGLLTPARLDEALRAQEAQAPMPPLGVVLVELGFLTHAQIDEVLTVQAAAFTSLDPRSGEVEETWHLGHLAIERRLATVDQVNRALREQGRRAAAGDGAPRPPLGQILVEQGVLSAAAVTDLLRQQRQVAPTLADATPVTRPAETAPDAPHVLAALPTAVGDAPTLEDASTLPPPPGSAGTFAAPGAPAEPPIRPSGERALEEAAAAAAAAASAAAARPFALRRKFGKYELLQELGRGGMGVVYKAYRPDLRAYFAVKVLIAGDDASPRELERFHREAQAAARLRHPGVVTVHDIGVEDGKTYFAMEYVEGITLDRLLDDPVRAGLVPARRDTRSRIRSGPDGEPGGAAGTGAAAGRRVGIQPAEAVRITQQIAEAIQHAHEAGVIHRDLKPANVLREPGGRIKVMDFGLAKLADAGQAKVTKTGAVMGTPQYMSPEQADGDVAAVDAVSDVYQIGAILYELLTGRPPYDGKSSIELIRKVILEDPLAPRSVNAFIDKDAETICLKAMAREKHQRYAAAREIADDCRRYLNGEPVRARRESWGERALRYARRRRLAVAALAGLVAALALAGGFAWRAHVARLGQEEAEGAAAARTREAARVRADKDRLRAQLLTELREKARLCLVATLRLRRVGTPMEEARQEFLPALEAAAAAVAADAPELAEPHYHLGRMYRALLRFDDALRKQTVALARDPDFAPSRYERAVLTARAHADRLQVLRAAALAREGARLAQAGGLAAGGGGERGAALPDDAALAAADETATRQRRQLLADLAALDAQAGRAPADSLDPARLACARGLAQVYAPQAAPDPRPARDFLETALRADRTLEEAYEGLAQLGFLAGQLDVADAAFTRGLAVDRGYLPFWSGRASARGNLAALFALRGGDPQPHFAGALDDYAHALELDATAVGTWADRAVLRMNWGSWQMNRGEDPGPLFAAAIADQDRAIELAPKAAGAWLWRGEARRNWGAYQVNHGADPAVVYGQAEADCTRALELAPDSADARLRRGRLRTTWGGVKAGRGEDPEPLYTAALEDFQKALELNPGAADAWAGRADLCADWTVARQARGLDPEPLWTDAVADYGKALALDGGVAQTWAARGSAHRAWGRFLARRGRDPQPRYQAAVADYRKALELNPQAFQTWSHLGFTCLLWAEFRLQRGADPGSLCADAETAYGKALALNPTSAESWCSRGQLRRLTGTAQADRGGDPERAFADALADYAKALELNPRSLDAWLCSGDLRLTLGARAVQRGQDPEPTFARAARDYEKALELNPTLAATWTARAYVHLNWGAYRAGRGEDPSEAYAAGVRDLGRALERNPKAGEAWLLRAQIRLNWANWRGGRGEDADGLYAEADGDFGKALELNGAQAEAWASLGALRTNWGTNDWLRGVDPGAHYAGAQVAYRRALELNRASYQTWIWRGNLDGGIALWLDQHGKDPRRSYADAQADFGEAIALNATVAEAWANRGYVRAWWGWYRGRHGEADAEAMLAAAEADGTKALELNAKSADAWTARGRTRALWGRLRSRGDGAVEELFSGGRADLDRALGVNAGSTEALLWRGMIDGWWGDGRGKRGEDPGELYRAGRADLDAALKLDVRFENAWRERGVLRAHWAGDRRVHGAEAEAADLVRDAFADLTQAVALGGQDAEARWRRGLLFHAERRWAEAVADLEAALKMNPDAEGEFQGELEEARRRLAEEAGR